MIQHPKGKKDGDRIPSEHRIRRIKRCLTKEFKLLPLDPELDPEAKV